MWGLVLERPAVSLSEEHFYLWPENVPAWELWHALQTQWRWRQVGDGSRRSGLDYGGVESEFRLGACRVRPRDRRRRWDEVKLMERAALRVWERQGS